MIRRPPRSTLFRSSAASDVYKRQLTHTHACMHTHIHTKVHACAHTLSHAHTHTHTHAHTRTHMYACTLTHTYTHKGACMCTLSRTQILNNGANWHKLQSRSYPHHPREWVHSKSRCTGKNTNRQAHLQDNSSIKWLWLEMGWNVVGLPKVNACEHRMHKGSIKIKT